MYMASLQCELGGESLDQPPECKICHTVHKQIFDLQNGFFRASLGDLFVRTFSHIGCKQISCQLNLLQFWIQRELLSG